MQNREDSLANLNMLLEALKSHPDVEPRASPVAGGWALFYRGKPFAHFHNENEIDIRLGRKWIRQQKLTPYPDSLYHPQRSQNSAWIEIRFHTPDEMDKVLRIIQLAVNNCER